VTWLKSLHGVHRQSFQKDCFRNRSFPTAGQASRLDVNRMRHFAGKDQSTPLSVHVLRVDRRKTAPMPVEAPVISAVG
jgi:hypothetical protein